ncbi:hypothetical protein B0H10DRAFT_2235777 [Mycena sp. CBHHK59/15]|nr:hypothetical protein B0H10DRAFT_2235777 [Mycena sp. CBHHK59/15]
MLRGNSGKGKDRDQPEGTHPLDDELFAHMRETHEECFVCKRNDVRDQYFLNYGALETHFANAHHPCPHAPCPAHKFVVFGSALDLQAHIVEEHAGELGKAGRRVEVGWDEVRSGGGQGRGRGREPAAAAAPGGRWGRRREGFGVALTVEGESTPAPTPTPSPPPSRTDVDPAVAERHAAFLTRLASFAPNPGAAVPAARAAIRSFRASESSARDLISTLWSVVDARMEAAASIVNALVDLLDEGEQREAVLSAWRGFEVEQRRQFPELVPVPSAVGAGYAGIASGRVLNAKHATASRGGRQVWDRVAQAASSSSSPSSAGKNTAAQRFPTLGPASAAAPATGFAASSSFVPPASNGGGLPAVTPFSAHMPTAPATGKSKLSSALFPELPPSAAARQKAPVNGNVSLRNILGTPAPAQGAWGAGAGASDSTKEEGGAESGGGGSGANASGSGGGKKKGNKGKGKQTLFTLGTFPS